MDASNGRQSGAGSGVTARQAGSWLLVVASVLLVASLFVPWWSEMWNFDHSVPFRESFDVWSGLSGSLSEWYPAWQMSMAAWLTVAVSLVTVALTVMVVVRKSAGKPFANAMVALACVAAGVIEIAAAVLFIVSSRKSFIGVGVLLRSSIASGLIIAMVAGVMLIASGLLMLGARVRPELAYSAQGASEGLVG